MAATRLAIPSEGIVLEGWLHTPDTDGTAAAVVICHPHPLYGGSMHNNVVDAVASGLVARGLAAIRFNFRGVGSSGGEHSGGSGEQADVRAVLSHACTLGGVDAERIGLAGYSFGAGVAAAVADASIPALALIAAPLRAAEAARATLAAYSHPLLLLAGDRDQGCDPTALRELADNLGAKPEVRIVPGADHFWGGFESVIEEAVGAFFAKALATDRGGEASSTT